MTYTFRIEGDTFTMTSEARPGGSSIEIACRTEEGEATRVRLLFTDDGFREFAGLVERFKLAERVERDRAEGGGTPAAEATSGSAAAARTQRVERYHVALMPQAEVQSLCDALGETRDAGGSAADGSGDERFVIWQVPDPRAEFEGQPAERLYLSPAALRAARERDIPIDTLGEVSHHEVPAERKLLLGKEPLDWQQTAF